MVSIIPMFDTVHSSMMIPSEHAGLNAVLLSVLRSLHWEHLSAKPYPTLQQAIVATSSYKNANYRYRLPPVSIKPAPHLPLAWLSCLNNMSLYISAIGYPENETCAPSYRQVTKSTYKIIASTPRPK